MNLVNETTTNTEQTVLTLAEETSLETTSRTETESLVLNRKNYGCICCPETVLWYSFTATENFPLYAIYTSGDITLTLELYDNTETLLANSSSSVPIEISLIHRGFQAKGNGRVRIR